MRGVQSRGKRLFGRGSEQKQESSPRYGTRHPGTHIHMYWCVVYIPQGPSKPPSVPSPNRFAPVAPTFFFPLMAAFDCPVATLDLLGQDSLLLGSLLHTLGTVMYCATNAPLAPTMAAALLDFLWALRYHNEAYVIHSSHTTIYTVSQHIIY